MQRRTRALFVALLVTAIVVVLLAVTLRGREVPTPAPSVDRPTPVTGQASAAIEPPKRAQDAVGGDKRIEICGYGPIEAKDLVTPPRELQAALGVAPPALRKQVAALGASSALSDRAVALRFEAAMIRLTTVEAATSASRDCAENAACYTTALQMGNQAALPYVESLAQMAQQAADPVAYALAYNACRSLGAGGAATCPALSAQRWTDIEPDNGMAWLEAAAEAARRGDGAARAAALERAAGARRFDSHGGTLLRPIASAQARALPPLDRMSLQSAGFIAYTDAPIGNYQQAILFCRESDTPERRATCDRLATRLIEGGNGLIDLSVGRSIGERAGWPPERIAALKTEYEAMMWMAQRVMPAEDLAMSCAAVARMEAYSRDVMQFGEAGMLRRQIARSGATLADLAREFRAEQKRLQEEAASPR